jgi:hypothetical protein
VGKGQRAVKSEQAVDCGEWAVNSWQWTVGRGKVSPAPDSHFAKFRFCKILILQNFAFAKFDVFYEIEIMKSFSQILRNMKSEIRENFATHLWSCVAVKTATWQQ